MRESVLFLSRRDDDDDDENDDDDDNENDDDNNEDDGGELRVLKVTETALKGSTRPF